MYICAFISAYITHTIKRPFNRPNVIIVYSPLNIPIVRNVWISIIYDI